MLFYIIRKVNRNDCLLNGIICFPRFVPGKCPFSQIAIVRKNQGIIQNTFKKYNVQKILLVVLCYK